MAVSLIATSFAIHQNRYPAARARAQKGDPAHLLAAFCRRRRIATRAYSITKASLLGCCGSEPCLSVLVLREAYACEDRMGKSRGAERFAM